MADWSLIRSTLAAWVTAQTGLTCYWRRQPRSSAWGDQGYVLLDITALKTVGFDSLDTTYSAAGEPLACLTYSQEGFREFTFPVQVRRYRTADDVDAIDSVSRLRDSVRFPSVSRAFGLADLGFNTILADVDIETKLDGREMSVRQIDFRFNTTATASDAPLGKIASAIAAEFQTPEGAPPAWTGNIPIGS